MASRKNVRNTHIEDQIRALHMAVLDIVAVINRPRVDEAMIAAAGIPLDRALFPLLVQIERFGPIGVVELAERVGRDYTTVSRQVGRLEALELVGRQAGAADRRVREAVIAAKGQAMTDAVDAARGRFGRAVLAGWEAADVAALVLLMRRFADDLGVEASGG